MQNAQLPIINYQWAIINKEDLKKSYKTFDLPSDDAPMAPLFEIFFLSLLIVH